MANRAYLVGGSNADTAGPGEQGINYDPDTEIMAGASTQIPVFWLSLFEESHIRPHLVQGYRIPAAVCESSVARRLLAERRTRVLTAFQGCEAQWQAWEQLIFEAPFPFFKLDGTEIWDLDPDLFEAQLAPAIRWFSTGGPDEFAKLLSIAEIDGSRRADLEGHHLHGYGWVRAVPWKDE